MRRYRTCPSVETWQAVYLACLLCLACYDRLPSDERARERQVVRELHSRRIPLWPGYEALLPVEGFNG